MTPHNERISKSVINSRTALVYTIVGYILSLISRPVLIANLGDSIMGLNSMLNNMIQSLNVLEMGLASAISVSLFRPFAMQDYERVNEIMAIQRWFNRRIGVVVIVAGLLLMAFFPLIFVDIQFPLWWAYAGFSVVLFNAGLFYFFNYRQILLTASQNEYKVYRSYRLMLLLKVPVQIVVVIYLPHKYLSWLVVEFLFAIFASVALWITLRRNTPYWNPSKLPIATLRESYPEIKKMLSQLFIHRIGSFSLQHAVMFIIYAYASLEMVTQYYNYYMLLVACSTLIASVLGAIGSSVGNLVATETSRKVYSVFSEFYGAQFLIVSLFACSCYMFCDDLVALWLGEEYIIDDSLFLAMIAVTFFMMVRVVVDNFIVAYGLFSDVWATLAESALNIGLSILLGYYYGIVGVVTGVAVSQFVFIFLWKPIFLFTRGLKRSMWWYLWIATRNLGVMLISHMVVYALVDSFYPFESQWLNLLVRASVYAVCYLVVCHSLLSVVSNGMRMFNRRLINYLKR